MYYFSSQKLKVARLLSFSGLTVLVFFSMPITSQFLIKSIEFSTPKLPIENDGYIAGLSPSYIVVFGCWHSDDPNLPLVAKIHQCSLPRVIQAVQIWRKIPSATIVFSGYAGVDGKQSDPEVNAELAMELGVPGDKILLEIGTQDSEEEITRYKKLTDGKDFIVISSASHIPRLQYLFAEQNLKPVFSPAEYASSHGEFSWHLLIPSASGLRQSERGWYEVMGNLWVRLKSIF